MAKLAEGFGPIYDSKGKQIPRYKIDKYPEKFKDIILEKIEKRKKEGATKKKKKTPDIKNIHNLA